MERRSLAAPGLRWICCVSWTVTPVGEAVLQEPLG
jgi:hypothetical protein